MSDEDLSPCSSPIGKNDVSSTKSDKVSSSAMERRKISKPVMEKRRRARINASLSELKTFLLDMIKKEGFRQNKMEKADILELTVKHLRQLQRQHHTGPTTHDNTLNNTFRLGFSECASEVCKFLTSVPNIEPDTHAKLLDHLSRCIAVAKDAKHLPNQQKIQPQQTPMESPVKAFQCTNFTKKSLLNDNVDLSKDVQNPAISSNHSNIKCQSLPLDIPKQLSNTTVRSSNLSNFPRIERNSVFPNLTGESVYNQPSTLLKPIASPETRLNPVVTQSFIQQKAAPSVIPVGNVSNMSNGLQLVPIQFQNGETGYAIPTNILTGAIVSNCLLSVITPNVSSTLTSSTLMPSQSQGPLDLNRTKLASSSSSTCDISESVQFSGSHRIGRIVSDSRDVINNNNSNSGDVMNQNIVPGFQRQVQESDDVWRPW